MKKAFIMYILLIGYIVFDTYALSSNIPLYNGIINPILWIIIAGISFMLAKDDGMRVKDKKNKRESLIIAMIIYIIVYYLLGLVFGFQRTPYSKDLKNIIINLWSFGSVIILEEIVRFNTIKIESKKLINYIITTILFILVMLSFSGFSEHFSSFKTSFIYIISVLLPLIVENGVLTYLSYIGSFSLPIIYRLFVSIPEFILPIIPNFDWFMTALVGLSLPIIVFVYLNYVHVNKEERLSRRERKKYSPVVYIPAFVFIAVLAGFVIGLFKYQPIAILSGSMAPTFDRGDAVVVEKLNDYEKKHLKVGEVIQYISGNKYVVHRIVDKDKDKYGNDVYITKGDFNNARDADPVSTDNVIGKEVLVIPFIGYPSVWLSGIMS